MFFIRKVCMIQLMLITGLWVLGARAALLVETVIGGIASAKPLQMVGPRPQLRYHGVWRAADPVKERAGGLCWRKKH